MEDDDEIQAHPSSPPPNGRIAVTVSTAAAAAAGPAPAPTSPPPPIPLTLALPIQNPQKTPSSGVGGRDDCWSEEATAVLIDAWGERYLELSRGNLKQKHWKDVADAVGRREDLHNKTPKTDVQCKNRIDTVKKKYKLERAKISAGGPPSKWRFYHKLNELIGPTSKTAKTTSITPPPMEQKVPVSIPVGLRSSSSRKPALKKNPPIDSDDETEPENSPDSSDGLPPETNKRPRLLKFPNDNKSTLSRQNMTNKKSDAVNNESDSSGNWGNSMKELTRAILKFGEVYEQAETAKLQQIVEMEKQRMKFAKDLELQRMQNFMKTQLELSQLKVRRPGKNNNKQE
ncbi:sequence-specific DNA binding transcription factors [Striga asiatica]|uniref:Sequence-specific DNA binding transcription factors n=1 Tax=Striga asiatica TaxID=4170 RepID=A0A5A7P6P0_STRAF|nr:sequence-specific DNA binding transcription factors [Striga asiatica]